MTVRAAARVETSRDSVVIGVADMRVSIDTNARLITYALGSCIAVCVYDPVVSAAGMLHYMLPLSKASPDKAVERPLMFADKGVPLLFKAMYDLGCSKRNLIVKVAGGGSMYDDKGVFNIGKRNYTVLRKLFWKNGVVIEAEDVGGTKSRTVSVSVATGATLVVSQGKATPL